MRQYNGYQHQRSSYSWTMDRQGSTRVAITTLLMAGGPIFLGIMLIPFQIIFDVCLLPALLCSSHICVVSCGHNCYVFILIQKSKTLLCNNNWTSNGGSSRQGTRLLLKTSHISRFILLKNGILKLNSFNIAHLHKCTVHRTSSIFPRKYTVKYIP